MFGNLFGDHAAYIVPTYLATTMVILGLIAWVRMNYTRHKKELRLLEAKGIKRASAK